MQWDFLPSFVFIKTGMLFVGALICILAGIAADLVIIEIAYNIIVSKKCKKTRMALQFISAVIACGIGIGFILIGMSGFNYSTKGDNSNIVETKLYVDYEEGLSVDSYYKITFVEEDRDNIKLVADHSKYFYMDTSKTTSNTLYIYGALKENEEFNMIRDSIDSINRKEIPAYEGIYEVRVYASKDVIEKLQENESSKIKRQRDYNNRINQLEQDVSDKQDTIDDLTERIDELEDLITRYEENLNKYELQDN